MTARAARQQPAHQVVRRSVARAREPALLHAPPDASLRIGELHRAIGNQAVGRLLQRKLTISQPGDVYEQEADRVADAVMRDAPLQSAVPTNGRVAARPLQRSCSCGGTCADCQEEEALQRKEAPGIAVTGAGDAAPPIVVDVLRSPGEALGPAVRQFMEQRFGRSFEDVRVHTDSKAAASASAVNAAAYTVGHDIVFATGRYAPGTASGGRLLAHELTHVVQQTAPLRSVIARRHVAADAPAAVQLRAAMPAVQREKNDLVRYTGGTTGLLIIEKDGKEIFRTRAVSGHPGTKEYQKGAGPTPTGIYTLHPAKTNSTVTALQAGTCGALPISSGFQALTSDELSPCTTPSHYCTASCPTREDPGRTCFTPKQCWGDARIKIEGNKDVADPTGKIVHRDGFYIHGGAHATAVTSGCIKVFDTAAFASLRSLKGAVPLCVGSACAAPASTLDIGSREDKCAVVCAAHHSIWRSVQSICRLAGERSAECARARDKYAESAERIMNSPCKCWG
jgi:hypothetical protein